MRNTSPRLSSLFSITVLFCVPWFLCSYNPGFADAAGLSSPIVGGRPVAAGEWPDVVAIRTEDDGLCTGTLLAADLVLTAAHCIEAIPVEVVVGSVDITKPDGQWRHVKWSRAYPQWRDRYDVGVIMLENPVFAKQRAIAQGCTPRKRITRGTQLEVVGFGLTTPDATDDNTRLHAATIEVVDPTCATDPACNAGVAPHGELIAGGHGVDACFGDSGGPAYVATANGPALVGIVSRSLITFDEPCGEGGVFVRVDKVVSWIESVTGRKLDRVACDQPADRDAAGEPGGNDAGCSAGAGALHSGVAVIYGLLCVIGLRRARSRRVLARR